MRPESTDTSLSTGFLVRAPHLIIGPRQPADLKRGCEDPILRGRELSALLPHFQRVQHPAGDVERLPRLIGFHIVHFLADDAALYTERAVEPIHVRPS